MNWRHKTGLAAALLAAPISAYGQAQVYAPIDPRVAMQEAADAKAKADAADERAQAAADLARAAMNVANNARNKANEAAQAAATPGPAGLDGTNGTDGHDGTDGTDGRDGTSPAFTIDSTTTLPPGSPATVTMGGTEAAPTLAFGIPQGIKGDDGGKGDKGDKGDTGPASTVPGPAGAASTVPGPAGRDGLDSVVPGPPGSAATIAVGTVTTSAAGGPASVVNAGTPSAALLNFTLPRGAAGTNGTNGATGGQGPAGTPGQAATVTIGTVTTGAPGTAASVTNSGTTSAAVFNWSLPRGDVGATGATGAAGPSGATFLANVTIAQTATVAIPLGPRLVTVPLSGCLAGERILLTPLAALPAGYGILDASCFTAGVLSVNVYGPALIIGGAYSIAAKTTVFR